MKSRAILRLKAQTMYQEARNLRDDLEAAVGNAHPVLTHIDKVCAELEMAARELGGKRE